MQRDKMVVTQRLKLVLKKTSRGCAVPSSVPAKLPMLDFLPFKNCQYSHIIHLNLVILDTRISAY